MRALTLHQPWASLVAAGAKAIETRSWSTPYRGLLAVHAAKAFPEEARAFAITSRHVTAHLDALGALGAPVPRGAFVAVARLVNVLPVEQLLAELTERERGLGDYAPGRFAWLLNDVRPLRPPVPCRGWQGLWGVPAKYRTRLLRETGLEAEAAP